MQTIIGILLIYFSILSTFREAPDVVFRLITRKVEGSYFMINTERMLLLSLVPPFITRNFTVPRNLLQLNAVYVAFTLMLDGSS